MNKVFLIGHIGREFSLKQIPSGKDTCSFPLATSKHYMLGNDKKTDTQWHNIVVFGGPAKWASENLGKGSKVFVEGEIRNRSYDAKDGTKKYISEVMAFKIESMTSLQKDAGNKDQAHTPDGDKQVLAEASKILDQAGFDFTTDDIPF